MKSYTEEQVAEALAAIQNGTSLRQASKNWAIPKTTLANRLSGRLPREIAHESEQRFSVLEEEQLASWVLCQANLGFPPTYQELRIFAERVLRTKGDSTQLGKHWLAAFLKRNPNLKAQGSFRTRRDLKKVEGAATTQVTTTHSQSSRESSASLSRLSAVPNVTTRHASRAMGALSH